MQRITKTISIILFLSILLSACRPVMPIMESESTPTVVLPMPQPSLPNGTPTATPAMTDTPELTEQDYELQPWSAEDDYYLNLADNFKQDHYSGMNETTLYYDLVFQAEKLLRDPSIDWREIAWKISWTNPKGIPLPGMRLDEDLLAFLMEDLLNNKSVTPEELPKIVSNKMGEYWDCYRAEIAGVASEESNYLIVHNLFGDQQDGWIFYTGRCESTAIYVLHKMNDQYIVEKLRDWEALEIPFAGYSLLLNTLDDINNNGIPEVVIDISFGSSGTPPFSGENLEIYEWDTSAEMFVSGSTEMFEDFCFDFHSDSCDDAWRVETVNLQGVHPIIVKELISTMYSEFREPLVCEPLVIEHYYVWKDQNLSEQQQITLSPTDERKECQLSWALQALNYEIDTATAAEMISHALSDWPASMNEMWGPASQDYYALQLGLYYDMHGREDEALSLLKTVAEHPYNSEFQFASQLASTYLDVRSTQGRVNACAELRLLQQESEFDIGVFVFVPVESIREAWGFGASLWWEQIDDICDEKKAVELLVQQARPAQIVDINKSLGEIHPEATILQTFHETPSLQVWLVSLPASFLSWNNEGTALERFEDQQIWLFVKTPNRFSATFLDDVNKDARLSVDTLELDPSGLLITIEPDDSYVQRFMIFYVAANGDVQSQLSDYYVDGFVDHAKNEIVTITESDGSGQPEIAVYRWNRELGSLDRQIMNYEFSKAQKEAERLLFQERDFAQTIFHTNKFFIQSPPEAGEALYSNLTDDWYTVDWYRPYLRYLLALSYEMSGDLNKARDVYYALWQEYPENIFGLTAQHRLGKKTTLTLGI